MSHASLIRLTQDLFAQPDEHDGILGIAGLQLTLADVQLEFSTAQINGLLDPGVAPLSRGECAGREPKNRSDLFVGGVVLGDLIDPFCQVWFFRHLHLAIKDPQYVENQSEIVESSRGNRAILSLFCVPSCLILSPYVP